MLIRGRALALAALLAAPAAALRIEPPPGWADVTAQTRAKDVLAALKGPEGASFTLSRAPSFESAAAARSYLLGVLEGARAGSGRDFRASSRLESRVFQNGLGARLLRAELAGRPRLIVALIEGGAEPLLAVLSSAAPEAMLAELVGGIESRPPAPRSDGAARSLDGQLELSLGGGLRSRAPTPPETRQGLVLAVQGAGSEVVFLKRAEDDVAPREQADVARATVAGALRVSLETVSPARVASTPAGPSAVYAWSRVPGSPDLRFAAGYLPWCYWGYSVLARGPQADELLVGTLAALRQGPSAVPRLVAATPRLPVGGQGRRWGLAGAAAGLLAACALAWRIARKYGRLGE